MLRPSLVAAALVLSVGTLNAGRFPAHDPQAAAAAGPAVTEGDFIVKSHTFRSGEKLDNIKLHYRTLGAPKKDAQGIVRNAVLVMHGTGGTGA